MQNEQTLSLKTIKNSLYNFAAIVWPVLFSLIVTPILISLLGVSDYGIYVVINVLIGFLSLLDLGLIPTLIRSIANYYEEKNLKSLYEIINSIFTIYLFLGFILGLFLLLFKDFIMSLLKINLSTIESLLIIIMVGIIFLANGIKSVLGSIINGLQRYDIGSKVLMWNIFILNIMLVFLAYIFNNVIALIFAQLISLIFLIFGYFFFAKKLLPNWKLILEFKKKLVIKEMSFSFYIFINQIVSMIFFQLDKLILSFLLGPAIVPYYSLPGAIAQKMQDVSSGLTGNFFPLSTQLNASNNKEKIISIYKRTIRMIIIISSSLMVTIIIHSEKILQFWLGGDFAVKSSKTLIVLTLTYFFIAIFIPLNNFLMGQGKIKDLVFINIIMSSINIILFFILVPKYNIFGAALAYLFGALLIPLFFLYAEKKYFYILDSFWHYFKIFFKILITSIIIFLIYHFIIKFITNLFLLLFSLFLSFIFFFIIYYIFGFFQKEDIDLFRSIIKYKYGR